jgi:uncharacterized protein YjcR
MHGGAPGSGAPKGNQNALKHGYYSKVEIEFRQNMRAIWKRAKEAMGK